MILNQKAIARLLIIILIIIFIAVIYLVIDKQISSPKPVADAQISTPPKPVTPTPEPTSKTPSVANIGIIILITYFILAILIFIFKKPQQIALSSDSYIESMDQSHFNLHGDDERSPDWSPDWSLVPRVADTIKRYSM